MVDELPEASDGHGGRGGEGGRPAGLGRAAGSAAAHPALHPALLLLVKGVATWVAATIFEKKTLSFWKMIETKSGLLVVVLYFTFAKPLPVNQF